MGLTLVPVLCTHIAQHLVKMQILTQWVWAGAQEPALLTHPGVAAAHPTTTERPLPTVYLP